MKISKFLMALTATTTMAANVNAATTRDVDITFVIDSSGSMGGEFSFLGGAIGDFMTALNGSSVVGTARAALVRYTGSATLVQDMTSDISTLQTAFSGVGTGGGTENAYGAVKDAAFNLGVSYSANAVRSLILITDEDADDSLSGAGGAALQADLIGGGFLNNIIYRKGNGNSESDKDFSAIAISSLSKVEAGAALFDIAEFRNDRAAFFKKFTEAKLGEIEDVIIVGEVPLPAALPLMVVGLGALSVFGARRRA